MDAETFLDDVRDDHETPLSRLGSSKWVYALTGGEMDAIHVRAAAADEFDAARETFVAWTDDEADVEASDRYAAAAERAASHYDVVAPDGHEATAPALYATLADLDGSTERAGGFLGWTLVVEKTLTQMVGFFVGDADPGTANTFRGFKGDIDADREAALATLDSVCDDEEAWTAARTAADSVVEAAYDDYVETLESMGIKPKNVC